MTLAAVHHLPAAPERFRAAMRGLASTVCVVTAPTAKGLRGMTATAVMSLSMEPASLAVAVNRSASLNPFLGEGAPVSIHLLDESQADIAKAFAGALPQDDRFSVGWWSSDAWGCPMLENAAASLSCVIERRVELATHSLVVALVRGVRTHAAARPLLYAHGQFTALADPACGLGA